MKWVKEMHESISGRGVISLNEILQEKQKTDFLVKQSTENKEVRHRHLAATRSNPKRELRTLLCVSLSLSKWSRLI